MALWSLPSDRGAVVMFAALIINGVDTARKNKCPLLSVEKTWKQCYSQPVKGSHVMFSNPCVGYVTLVKCQRWAVCRLYTIKIYNHLYRSIQDSAEYTFWCGSASGRRDFRFLLLVLVAWTRIFWSHANMYCFRWACQLNAFYVSIKAFSLYCGSYLVGWGTLLDKAL